MQPATVLSLWMGLWMMACDSQWSDKTDTNLTVSTVVTATTGRSETARGIVYRSVDTGTHWTDISDGLPGELFLTDLAVSDELLAIATKQHGIFLFDSPGNRWRAVPSRQVTTSPVDALVYYHQHLFAGTGRAGVFTSADLGKTWQAINQDLGNLTIRTLKVINDKLYAGTNGGLYSWNEARHRWIAEYEMPALQVNGITGLDGEIYIGTNSGVFKATEGQKNWQPLLTRRSLHNISSDGKMVYAMVYNELMVSTDKGASWKSLQSGLPPTLYTFQIIPNGNTVFAGQWDGVYVKDSLLGASWRLASNGLPEKFAVTEMAVYKNNLIATSSLRTQAMLTKVSTEK